MKSYAQSHRGDVVGDEDFKFTMERLNWMSTKGLPGSTVDLVRGEDHYFALAPIGVFSGFSSAVFFSVRI